MNTEGAKKNYGRTQIYYKKNNQIKHKEALMNFDKELLISLKQRVIDIENLIKDTGVERGLRYLPTHCGDIEAIIKILSKYYEEKYSGWELLEQILNKRAKKNQLFSKLKFWRK